MKHKTCKNETIFCRNLCYPIYKYAHSSSRKNEKSEKKFQLYICFIKKIPRIEQLNTMQLHAKEATRRCMSPKKSERTLLPEKMSRAKKFTSASSI